MFDKTKFLVVGDALLGVDRANNRLNAAKAQLETAKGIVEAARADIETAKEGVTTAKANLDTILTGFDNSGLSKATILSTAEDLNRVFSAVEPVAEQEVVAEPELSKASARKVIDSLRDLLSTVSDREDYADLRSPLEEILAAVQSVGGSAKDDSETKPKRKRRSKGEEDETSAAEATAVVSTEAVDPAAATATAAVEIETAEVVVVAEEQQTVEAIAPVVETVAEVEVAVEPVVEIAEIVEEVPVEAVAEAVADVVVNEVNNDEIKDEIIELIDSNVPAGDLNNLIATTAFAVYLGSQDRPLSLGDFLDAMTLETVKSANGADYLDDEMRGLVANMLEDSAYVSSALTWFVAGVRALENGKDFPAFEGVVQTDVTEEATAVEEAAEEAADVHEVAAVEIAEAHPVEEVDLTSADDQTIVGQVDDVSEDVVAEDEPLVLEEAEEVSEPVEEVSEAVEEATDAVAVETAPAVVEPVTPTPAPAPVEKPASAPARPAPSAPSEGLKKPNFFQRPSFPTKG